MGFFNDFRIFRAFLLVLGLMAVIVGSVPSTASPNQSTAELQALLSKLGAWSRSFEAMMHRSSYTLSGRIDALDGKGAVTQTKSAVLKVSGYRDNQRVHVVRYIDDGDDETANAREEVAEAERKRKSDPPDPEDEVRLPFLPSEQRHYSFSIVERDRAVPSRVRVHFTPKQPAKNRVVGSAWVDASTGEVLSIGASPSKLPTFVDYLRVTIELDEQTPAGRAVSRVRFEGKSSFLVFAKRFRGEATLSGYRVR